MWQNSPTAKQAPNPIQSENEFRPLRFNLEPTRSVWMNVFWREIGYSICCTGKELFIIVVLLA